MTTSLALFALAGMLTGATGDKPTWLSDYTVARQLGRMVQRPLAVVVGSGQEGWERLSQEGKLGKEVNRLLAANYVCVYVDSAAPSTRALTDALEVAGGRGLVISDHSGQVQAFHHQGNLAETTLETHLRRYADPQRVVRHTETNPVQRVSYYPPTQSAPTYSTPSFAPSFGGGRSC